MAAILRFFIRFAPFIYGLLAIGLVIAIRRLFRARAEMRQAIFGLEHEIAQNHLREATATFLLFFLLVVAEVVLMVFLAPNLPASALLSTPTMNLQAVPTNTLPAELRATFEQVTPMATQTPQAVGCIPGQIIITSPKAGSEIRGRVTLEGSADVPNFGFYKYEFSLLGADLWTPIQAGNTPVRDGQLGEWDTREITPGDYQLRLVVTNNQGEAFPPCIIPVRILAP